LGIVKVRTFGKAEISAIHRSLCGMIVVQGSGTRKPAACEAGKRLLGPNLLEVIGS
jgi:hypothetical protein